MSENQREYRPVFRRDCDNCSQAVTGTQECALKTFDTHTCLSSQFRPFWRPRSGDPCGICANDDGHDIFKCVNCDKDNSNFERQIRADARKEAASMVGMNDMIDQETKYDPKSRYYDHGGIEVLEIIKAKLTPEQYQGFCLGNAIKYTCRANHKGDYDRDMEKAEFYAREAR